MPVSDVELNKTESKLIELMRPTKIYNRPSVVTDVNITKYHEMNSRGRFRKWKPHHLDQTASKAFQSLNQFPADGCRQMDKQQQNF